MPIPTGVTQYLIEALVKAQGEAVDLATLVNDRYSFASLEDAARRARGINPKVRQAIGPGPEFARARGIFFWSEEASIPQIFGPQGREIRPGDKLAPKKAIAPRPRSKAKSVRDLPSASPAHQIAISPSPTTNGNSNGHTNGHATAYKSSFLLMLVDPGGRSILKDNDGELWVAVPLTKVFPVSIS